MTTGHVGWHHLTVIAEHVKSHGNGMSVLCHLRFTKESAGFLSVKFCFTAQDHVVTNEPNRSGATVIVVAPSGEAVVSTGKVCICRLSRFLLFAAYLADAECWRRFFGCF